MVRVYVDGIFDMFHYGHAEMLERVKHLFPGESVYTMVGVNTDDDCKQYKCSTILMQDKRIRSVIHCKHVDEVISDAPWIIDQAFLDKYAIDYVCHDGTPYPGNNTPDVYKYVKSCGKFKHVDSTPDISTQFLLHLVLLKSNTL